jgi:flagellar protein FlaJ
MELLKSGIKMFSPLAEYFSPYFTELNNDLKKAGIKMGSEEFIAQGFFLSFLLFMLELPLLSFIFGFLSRNFLTGFLTSITFSFFILAIFLLMYFYYPKLLIKTKARNIENYLPFATVHLSTIASCKLPLDRVIEIFAKVGGYGEVSKEFERIYTDMKMFGLDVNTALERAVERTPSKSLKELLWGILSTNVSGGDLELYLREKAVALIEDYKRKLYQFSHQLSIYIEIYLTAVVLGAIFFVILTSIIAGISGVSEGLITLQFLMIFLFLPAISFAFLYLVKSITPGGG